ALHTRHSWMFDGAGAPSRVAAGSRGRVRAWPRGRAGAFARGRVRVVWRSGSTGARDRRLHHVPDSSEPRVPPIRRAPRITLRLRSRRLRQRAQLLQVRPPIEAGGPIRRAISAPRATSTTPIFPVSNRANRSEEHTSELQSRFDL